MRRPRRAGAVVGPQPPLPQSWVPRVGNAAVGMVLLLFLVPFLAVFGGSPWYLQVAFVLFGLPLMVLGVCALSSAIRPGSVARFFRLLRRRR